MSGAPSAQVFIERQNAGVGTTKLLVEATQVTEAVSNKVISITIPLLGGGQDSGTNLTQNVDLKRIDFIYNITGFIGEQTAPRVDGSPDVKLTALQAKSLLIHKIIYARGPVNLYWRGCTKIHESGDDSGKDAVSPTTNYAQLMEDDDALRKTRGIITMAKFDDSTRQRLDYKYLPSDGYNGLTATEYGPKRIGFTMKFTRGVDL